MNKLIILLICTLIGSVRLQASNSQGSSSSKVSYQNPCISKTTCRECIQTQNCAWCLQPNFGDAPRCFQPDLKSMSNVCEEEFTWYPDNEQVLITNRELTRKRSKKRWNVEC
jgi:protocadherin alpha